MFKTLRNWNKPKKECLPIVVATKTQKQKMFDKVFTNVRKKMVKEEGYRQVVYKDSIGKATVGIGHLVLPKDKLRVGNKISKERVELLFKSDVLRSIKAAMAQAQEIGQFEYDFILALTSVNFQLGNNWPSKWPNTYKQLNNGNFKAVIRAVKNSKWARQTPKRTEAFIMALMVEMNEDQRTYA